MDVDHLHELQLNGVDAPENLWMLDQSTNRSIGSQLSHQLKKLPAEAKITQIKVRKVE